MFAILDKVLPVISLFSTLAAANTTSTVPATTSDITETLLFALILIWIVSRRLYKGMKGTVYSTSRVVRLPVIYAVLTALFSATLPLTDILFVLLAGALGITVGLSFGDTSTFYKQTDQIHYRRSPAIMVIWLIAFIARVFIDFYYGFGFYSTGTASFSIAVLLVDILLGGTTGLIGGEAIHTIRRYDEFRNSQPEGQQQN